jgi:hypothetical protein
MMFGMGDTGEIDVARIAASLAATHADFARVVADPSTSWTELPAPFLLHTRIYEFEKFLPTRPLLVYVGWADDGTAFVLNQRPDEFNRMMARDGARIEDPGRAVELARTFVHVTRPQNRRYLLVSSVDELPWMPGLEGPAVARAQEQRRAVGAALAPPGATPAAGGWDVDFFVVDGNSLDRLTTHVAADGQVRVDTARRFDDLLLTYTL